MSLSSFLLWQNYTESQNQGKILPKVPREQREKDRSEYYFNLLRDPKTNEIPQNIRLKELAFAKSHDAASVSYRPNARINYTFHESGLKDIGGRTRALAHDTRDTKIMLAAGVSGGIFKSINEGESWFNVSDASISQSITSIAQDLSSPNTWYAVGGEFYGNSARDRGRNAN